MTSRISASFRVLIDDGNIDDCCSEDYDSDPFFQDVTTYDSLVHFEGEVEVKEP